MRRLIILLAFVSLQILLLPHPSRAAEQHLTQRDWMINLVDSLGYGFGLPDDPEDADYIALLEGQRSYRFEAETWRNPDDLAAVNSFSSFGPFSGSGWVSAISAPTKVRLDFLLPQSGTYRLFAAVRLPGHTLTLDGFTWKIDEEAASFHRVDLGEVRLDAGMKEMLVAMPANGSIDYIELTAPPLPSITPLGGWQPEADLTAADLAVTAIRALEVQSFLPLQGEKILVEAEANPPDKSFITDQRHLGEPHGGFWLRTAAGGGEITLPFKIENAGVYTLILRASGGTPLTGNLDTHLPWATDFPPYLYDKPVGTWYLNKGEHSLQVSAPPRGGVDLLTLERRRSATADYTTLTGLPPGEKIQLKEINRLLTLIARLRHQD